jgi:hypothetical protein
MRSYEAAAWGFVGASALEILEFVVANGRNKKRAWSAGGSPLAFIAASVIRITFAAGICAIVNNATPPLSIPAAIFVGIAGLSLITQLARLSLPWTFSEKERESRIVYEADRLAQVRESSSHTATPRGVSPEVADILTARREAIAGQLPVVPPSDEGSAAS